jgi:5-methylcytosine-specific restriction endonuclease McrA
MVQKLTYPDDWRSIATEIKKARGYRCDRCQRQCLPPTSSYRHLNLSIRRSLSAQVHHIDGNPQHNNRANLSCLCAPCHLGVHKVLVPTIEGQLSLKLKLPKARSTGKRKRVQFSLEDLIAKLPKLAQTQICQIELEID